MPRAMKKHPPRIPRSLAKEAEETLPLWESKRQRETRLNFHILERQANAQAIILPSGVQDM